MTLAVAEPGNAWTPFVYDSIGQRISLLDATPVTQIYEYDKVGRLTTQVSIKAGVRIATFVDTYDAVGRKTVQLRGVNGNLVTCCSKGDVRRQQTVGLECEGSYGLWRAPLIAGKSMGAHGWQ